MTSNIIFQMLTPEIGSITLNQIPKRNALSAQMWLDLKNAIEEAAQTYALKVLIVTGAGDHFAAGADISEFETLYATPKTSADISMRISTAMDALASFPKPTIAKIRGACVGGGCGISLACDIRIADETSKFAITPGKLGLVYPFADITRLIQAVGVSDAKDILFSARLLKAEEAKTIGLINRLVASDDLDKVVTDYAHSICQTSKQSNLMTKQMFLAYEAGQRLDTKETQALFLDGFASDDFKEGYSAFLDKRKPNF